MRLAKQSNEPDTDALMARTPLPVLIDWIAYWQLEDEANEAAIAAAGRK
jgi:hypothetical protein